MQQHINAHNLSKAPRKLLISEFKSKACFSKFVKEVSEARREGDKNPDTAIIADSMKLIGNSGYGSLIMDKTKHRSMKYVKGENKACLLVNKPTFRKLNCLDEENQYYEAEIFADPVRFFILQYAKQHMLVFYYDFKDTYIDRSDFEYVEMDTDSAYMAISSPNLESIIKPDMKAKYQKQLIENCNEYQFKADGINHWFPRNCCDEHKKFDKRVPGLFKMEFQGNEIIGLCSKTYIVTNGQDCKFSSKGINKNAIENPMEKFKQVLETGDASLLDE
ncbi:hypothetical protein KUTeg_022635 [Tegillarca granosa]|uniref:Uncharacterized protein n=1 Tax=Tegillarca granosa TaxID=220873 RepID=A0ABQ9E4X1_TEGGR|nr:hypothetical protein KUTeg_022635 [Tegillarca granosa]